MTLQTSMTIDANDDFYIRNVKAICLNAIPVDRNLKQRNLVIDATLFILEEEVKKKWRNLRDQFAKELKKVHKPHPGDAPGEDEGQYTGKWQYFTNLQFLRGIVAPRSTEGNVFHIEVLEESQTSLVDNELTEDEDSLGENSTTNVGSSSQVSVTADVSQVIATTHVSQEIDTADVPQLIANNSVSQANTKSGGLQVNKKQREPLSDSTNVPSASNITPSRSKRKRTREEGMDVEERLLNIEAKKLALLETPEDENSLFLRSLLPYFKKMDPLQQLRVRTKFQEILIQEMSPQSTSLRPYNTYFPVRPSTAV